MRTLLGKSITLEAEPSSQVLYLKQHISSIEGMSLTESLTVLMPFISLGYAFDRLNLIYNGQLLQNGTCAIDISILLLSHCTRLGSEARLH